MSVNAFPVTDRNLYGTQKVLSQEPKVPKPNSEQRAGSFIKLLNLFIGS